MHGAQQYTAGTPVPFVCTTLGAHGISDGRAAACTAVRFNPRRDTFAVAMFAARRTPQECSAARPIVALWDVAFWEVAPRKKTIVEPNKKKACAISIA